MYVDSNAESDFDRIFFILNICALKEHNNIKQLYSLCDLQFPFSQYAIELVRRIK